MAPDILTLRRDFPTLAQIVNGHPLVYLDNAATTQKPQPVLDALNHYYRDTNANVHRASHALSAQATRAFEQARIKVARFINAPAPEQIIWTRGTTEAINLVAFSFGMHHLRAGDEILLSTLEHHANIVPWQQVAAATGAVIRVIPLTAGAELDLDAAARLISPRTRLLAVGQVSNALGVINPVRELIAMAKSVGAVTLIDGAQAVGHLPVDVQSLDCDFYVFSGHKMFAPTGIGALYGKREWLEKMPPWQTGGEMIKKVSFEHTTFADLPFKFEAGTPNIAGAIALGAAVDYLSGLDRAGLAHHENNLLQQLMIGLNAMPDVHIIGRPQVGSVSFTIDEVHPQDLATLLDMQGIALRTGHHCAMPLMQALGLEQGTIRASVAFYNTHEEIAALLAGIHKAREFF
ncbi:SufS family cysteine desulfurase [Oceanisphaera litoralis]|uniref:aminotransferase class V-fold PLP-dependent enzyme n=1 Tax=Oceanisphaera litoralis TaxID=225144 RepID=UPI00195B6EF2|nr:SufS family cysteine desulfurase [Oceanisphaera litoralis]MBM7456089.1 SufS family cysteine desulfurase [Oceanisphaera litoralis]